MKNHILLRLFALLYIVVAGSAFAQDKVAEDFNLSDCDGNQHTLFSKLDNGEVVILEFVMTCGACADVRKELTTIESEFAATHPGKLTTYIMAYTNTYSCGNMQAWMNANQITGTVFTGTKAILEHYGQFGMPTTVVVGGKDHKVLYMDTKGNPNYTAIRSAISQALATGSVETPAKNAPALVLYPNPATDKVRLDLGWVENPSIAEVWVVNTAGIELLRQNVSVLENGAVDLSSLSAGIYTVFVSSGQEIRQSSVVVQ